MNNSATQCYEYMTVAEVKKYLNISQAAAYELTHSVDFPVCRFGGSIRVPRQAFLAWVDQRTTISKCLARYMATA